MGRRLRELAALFLRLGVTAFGGPAAHIALMDHEVVERRRWLSREEFLDLVGATNLIPGPNSTELAIHIGHRRAGWRGLLVAGSCFIVPAALITVAIAWAYVRWGQVPRAQGLLRGVEPVVVAVVVQALAKLARTVVKSLVAGIVGAAAFIAALLGVHELAVLAAAGAVMVARRGLARNAAALWPLGLVAAPAASTGTASAGGLFWIFLKIGSVLYGSGYVLLAFMRGDLVHRMHWLTEGQLLDAVAAGQITPGPVFSTAAFVGYVVAGGGGAAAATVGIFLPAFVFVALSGPLVPRIRQSPVAGALLDGVNLGSLALMAAVSVQLIQHAVTDVPTVALALASLALLQLRVNSAWLVLGGAIIGLSLG